MTLVSRSLTATSKLRLMILEFHKLGTNKNFRQTGNKERTTAALRACFA